MRKFIDIIKQNLNEDRVVYDRGDHMTKLTSNASIINNQAFRQWFGQSKVVDKSGNPLICYHGTFEEFTEFKIQSEKRKAHGFNRLGYWFDVDPATPSWFAGYNEKHPSSEAGSVMPVFLKIVKPFYVDSSWLFPYQRNEYKKLHNIWTDLVAQRQSGKRDKYDNIILPDGSYFDDSKFRQAEKQMNQYTTQLASERGEGFERLMRLLPKGSQSSDQEVDAFKAELIAEGHDGIRLGDTTADWGTRDHKATDWWIAFNSNQIKSIYSSAFTDSPHIHEDQ